MRRIILLLLLTLLQACGSSQQALPYNGAEQALVSPTPFQPISVSAPAETPGLGAALVRAFDKEQDIAASEAAGGDKFLRMSGSLDGDGPNRTLHWRIAHADGSEVGAFSQIAPAPPLTPRQMQEVALTAAASAARLLRGDDLGAADLAARPKVKVEQVSVTGALDADLLKRSLIAALEQRSAAVVSEQAQFKVSGTLRITQGLGGHDLVEITWIVSDAQGTELGKVNQGSPVIRDELLAHASQLTHQIAEGGAEGVMQIVHSKLGAHN